MIIALFALVPFVAAGNGAADVAWCERAFPLAVEAPADGPEALAAFEALALAMPAEASPVVARARELAGEDGIDRSMSVLRFAVVDACAPGMAIDQEALARSAAALMDDPRFTGIRKGDGVIDRVMNKIWMFLVSLVESEGMQEYASASRVLFLSLIALGAVGITVVTLRKRRVEAAAASAAGGSHVEAVRKEAYAALRAQADALVAKGDARGALRAGDAALLARLGELDGRSAGAAGAAGTTARAVTPARTHREIVARLPGAVGDVVRAPFASFDALFFGRPSLTADDARAFLTSVDAAEAGLERVASPAGAASDPGARPA